ncbi:MAG: hypothetical protein IIY07_07930 [Thermoguttaceae bacterium]|nr:hypothetical protein [Thermoguttaceae bacterium]
MRRKKMGRKGAKAFVAAAILATLVGPGCASRYAEHLKTVRRDLYDGGALESAKAEIERRSKKAPKKEQDVLTLNAASVALCEGSVGAAKAKLLAVRDRFDELEVQAAKRTGENLLTYLADENVASYEGEDYEKVLIRAYLTLAELLSGSENGDGGDARAFAKQIVAKQDAIVRGGAIPDPENPEKTINPKTAYPRVPLGAYLEGLLLEETYADQNEAARRYEQVAAWAPDFKQAKADVERARTSVHSQPGNGCVYVFAFVGRGPCKEQVYSEATQISLLIADQIFSATNKYAVPPTVAPVPIPQIVVESPRIACVSVEVDGERSATTETLADVNEMASRQFEATKNQVVARAVVRRIVKKGTIYAAQQVGQVNEWIGLAANVAGVVWEAAETADTRCWGLLPAQIQAVRLELPVGERRLTLYPGNRAGERIGTPIETTVRVEPNRNVYVLVNYPDREPLGTVVTSSR